MTTSKRKFCCYPQVQSTVSIPLGWYLSISTVLSGFGVRLVSFDPLTLSDLLTLSNLLALIVLSEATVLLGPVVLFDWMSGCIPFSEPSYRVRWENLLRTNLDSFCLATRFDFPE